MEKMQFYAFMWCVANVIISNEIINNLNMWQHTDVKEMQITSTHTTRKPEWKIRGSFVPFNDFIPSRLIMNARLSRDTSLVHTSLIKI